MVRRPQVLAAIDIGSNALRFTAVQRGAGGGAPGGPPSSGRLDYQRAAVRLGTAAFRTGRLGDDELERAAAALIDFRRRMDRLGVDRYRAVATSAVREASNGGELVERARGEAGIRVDVIDGAEEARLVWLAVRERLPVSGRWLLADLGGGSLEVSVVDERGIERSATYPLGTVRMLERVRAEGGSTGGPERGSGPGSAGDDIPAAVSRAVAEVESELAVSASPDLEGVMATGGNIEALAELARAPRESSGASRLSLDALSKVMGELEAMSYEARVEGLELRPDRADVIVPAGRVYRRVAELAGAAEIVVPNVGVTEGLLVELMR